MTEKIKNNCYEVNDPSFVRLLRVSGSIEDICKSARVSYSRHNEKVDKERDLSLLKYLIRNNHTSPLEMMECVYEISIPNFIAKQLIRHRTASINEVSLRYTEQDGRYYIPKNEYLLYAKSNNKQKGGDPISENEYDDATNKLQNAYKAQWVIYRSLIDSGVSKESSRAVLGTGYFTTLIWKIDVNNLLHFLRLRTASDSQKEMQHLANNIIKNTPQLSKIIDIVQEYKPLTANMPIIRTEDKQTECGENVWDRLKRFTCKWFY